MGKLTNKDLNALCKMQVKFKEIYNGTGLIGIDSNKVHISEREFFDNFDRYYERKRRCSDYPYGYSAYYNGVEFICITETRHEGAANDG